MNIIDKAKTMIGLKNSLIEALRADLERAVRIIQARDRQIQELELQVYGLQKEAWLQQDMDRKWIDEQLARMESDEHSNGYSVPVYVDIDREQAIKDVMEMDDIPFEVKP